MALSRNQNISLEYDVKTLIHELRRSVIKSCTQTGRSRMLTTSLCRRQTKEV
jgi:hypothetical protein